MTTHNLNDLSLAELKKLLKDLERAIENYDSRHRQTALAALEEKAKEFGFALSELFSSLAGRKVKKAPIAARYANPADPSKTWSGRGRRPGWFVDAIAEGRSAQSMEIRMASTGSVG